MLRLALLAFYTLGTLYHQWNLLVHVARSALSLVSGSWAGATRHGPGAGASFGGGVISQVQVVQRACTRVAKKYLDAPFFLKMTRRT